MIEHDPETLIAKCLDCGHTWSKNSYPLECPKCKIPSHRYRIRQNYLQEESRSLMISCTLKSRLNRRKQTPYEPYASVVDRLINNHVSTTLMYNNTQMKNTMHIVVSLSAHTKLKELKTTYKFSTFNEVLWRMI